MLSNIPSFNRLFTKSYDLIDNDKLPLLNRYPGAAAAYSLRRLNNNIVNVVRVRRSSDNDERDFSAAEIKNGSLVSWVGTNINNNGYVALWYDQSGNNKHAYQLTTSRQPKIVDQGQLLADGLLFSGNGFLDIVSSITSSQPITIFTVSKIDSNDIGFIFGTQASLSNISPCIYGKFNTTTYILYAGVFGNIASVSYDNKKIISSILYDSPNLGGNNSTLYIDNALVFSDNVGPNDKIDRIGDYNNSFYLNGSIDELIFYDKNVFENRTTIQSNIANEYGITLS